MPETLYECRVVPREQVLDDLVTALFGENDQNAARIFKMVVDWANEALARKPGQEMLCLDCDTCFNAHTVPEAFLVVLPVFESNFGTVSGICSHCMEGDVLEKARRRLAMMISGFEVKSFGHA
jgi:hypothetical protein